jgi:hypothetical protein
MEDSKITRDIIRDYILGCSMAVAPHKRHGYEHENIQDALSKHRHMIKEVKAYVEHRNESANMYPLSPRWKAVEDSLDGIKPDVFLNYYRLIDMTPVTYDSIIRFFEKNPELFRVIVDNNVGVMIGDLVYHRGGYTTNVPRTQDDLENAEIFLQLSNPEHYKEAWPYLTSAFSCRKNMIIVVNRLNPLPLDNVLKHEIYHIGQTVGHTIPREDKDRPYRLRFEEIGARMAASVPTQRGIHKISEIGAREHLAAEAAFRGEFADEKHTHKNWEDDVQDKLMGKEGFEGNDWVEFQKSLVVGQCKAISEFVDKTIKEMGMGGFVIKRNISTDYLVVDDDGESQHGIGHYWNKVGDDEYDFAKGTVMNYFDWDDSELESTDANYTEYEDDEEDDEMRDAKNHIHKHIHFDTIPMDADWKERLNESNAGYLKHRQNRTLNERLLSFGGEGVALNLPDDDTDKILSRGEILDGRGRNAYMFKGEAIHCHSNSCNLWEQNKGRLIIYTGWALSDDGCWREHTWLWDKSKNKIVETTERRVAYYGYAMTDDEAAEFASNNY